MDVVRRNIDALRGRIEIATEPGKGTTFLIRLPLTLAVLDGLIVGVGRERFVMPTTGVRESLRPLPSQVHTVQGAPRHGPGARLAASAGLARRAVRPAPRGATRAGRRWSSSRTPASRVGLVVDALLGKQEVVVKSLGEAFSGVRGIAGGAILGDGRIGLILDAHGIVGLERGVSRAAA